MNQIRRANSIQVGGVLFNKTGKIKHYVTMNDVSCDPYELKRIDISESKKLSVQVVPNRSNQEALSFQFLSK